MSKPWFKMDRMKQSHRGPRWALVAFLATAVFTCGCATSSHATRRPRSAPATSNGRGDLHTGSVQYLRIADAGNDQLEKDIDGLSGPDRNHLAAALADLRDASVTERLFDQRLDAIVFPSTIESIAKSVYTSNQARAELTYEAATSSSSLHQLRRYEKQISISNGKVEQQVRAIRSALGLPPPDTS
jgi:hypothetical protein